MLEDTQVERVLAVMAHPDDVDFGAAGTIALWTKAGIEVSYCIVTNGDAGGFDPDVPRSEIAGIRQSEQRAAAEEVGVTDVRFLGYQDGRVEVSLDLRRDIAAVIREVRPQRVLGQSPVRNMVRIPASHPDHIAVGEATMCAVYPDARNPFAFMEHPQFAEQADWAVSEVWIGGMERANRYVDVTEVYDRKVAALRRHASQMPGVADLDALLKMWLGRQAEAAGLPDGRLAEAFWVIETG
jgi:LmbE family N-acetylglucosaminyl deacetylase